ERTTHDRPLPASPALSLFQPLIDREPPAQLPHALAHRLLYGAVVVRSQPIEHAHYHLPELATLGRSESARRDRRRSQPDARSDRRLLRIEGDAVLVAGDAGALQAVGGRLARQLLRPEIDQHQMRVGAAGHEGETPLRQ